MTKVSYACQGLPILCPDGPGVILCMRLRPPDFKEVDSYSVLLDRERRQGQIAGTPADAMLCKPKCYAPGEVRPLLN